MLIDSDGTVFVPGTRVTEVVLDDATVIVAGGIVQGGSGLTIATIDFSARGGDQYLLIGHQTRVMLVPRLIRARGQDDARSRKMTTGDIPC